MSHTLGTDSDKVHGLAWNAFESATEVAKKEGLYGAGQDLLKDSFSGNVMGHFLELWVHLMQKNQDYTFKMLGS